jgi:hypothetical protein
MLRPELEKVDGFVDNIRYRSLTRGGWILSLSGWRDEKSVVRWCTRMRHHEVQEKGRLEILLDYHLRVGQGDPGNAAARRLRFAGTTTGRDGSRRGDHGNPGRREAAARVGEGHQPRGCCEMVEIKSPSSGPRAWDVFDAVLTPGDIILLMSWRDTAPVKRSRRGSLWRMP